jgi:DNA-binding transcriptional LysR family regulator
VQKLESLLAVDAFAIDGRKAVLTPTGHMLYRRARSLLEEAGGIERAAKKLSAGWEPEIWVAAEITFPAWLILDCLDRFGAESPQTRIELLETVIDGTPEALQSGLADIAISPRIPPNYNGEPLMPIRFIPVAHPGHPLHQLGREVTLSDLRKHRHLFVRDSGSQRDTRAATVEVSQRWTVTHMATSIGAACRGYGFAWFPEEKIRNELEDGELKPLPLRGGRERSVQLYLIFGDADAAGPGVRRLADIIRERSAAACSGHSRA